MSASSSCSVGSVSSGESLGSELDRRDGGVFDVVSSLERHVWRHNLEVLCGAPSVLAAVLGEAPSAMYAIADESKTKPSLGPTEFCHLPPAPRVDGALTREVQFGAAAVFGGDRRWSRRGDDA